MADLNLNPAPLNLVKSHFCVENGWSELKSGAPKSREIAFFASKMADLNLNPERCKNGDEQFWNRLLGIFASSSALALWVVVSVGHVGGLLFLTHSQQRARASRGQKANTTLVNIIILILNLKRYCATFHHVHQQNVRQTKNMVKRFCKKVKSSGRIPICWWISADFLG